MKKNILLLIVCCTVAHWSIADQWDEAFNEIISTKDITLPYSPDKGYTVFDLEYQPEQRLFTNHIQATDPKMTASTIAQQYKKDLKIFCSLPDTKNSLDSNITYQFLFYKEPTEQPFLTVIIDKEKCKNP